MRSVTVCWLAAALTGLVSATSCCRRRPSAAAPLGSAHLLEDDFALVAVGDADLVDVVRTR